MAPRSATLSGVDYGISPPFSDPICEHSSHSQASSRAKRAIHCAATAVSLSIRCQAAALCSTATAVLEGRSGHATLWFRQRSHHVPPSRRWVSVLQL